jgi:hypothetical protein
LIITESGEMSSELKSALSDVGITNSQYKVVSINPNSKKSAQGIEAEYVVSDKINFEGHFYTNFKKLYTISSRALKGCIHFDPENKISKTFNITSIPKISEKF